MNNTPTPTPEMLELLKDLADVLEKHNGGLTYTALDDGIYVTQGEDWESRVCIEWPYNGNVSRLRQIIQANPKNRERTASHASDCLENQSTTNTIMNDTPTPRERFRKTLDISTGVSEFLADCNTAYISWLETELTAVTEQRDELLRYNEAYRQDALICANCDAISKKEYDLAMERWNKLADLVRQFIYILDVTEESDGGRLFHPTNITSCRAGDLQKAGQLVEALRRASRNQLRP